MIVLVDLTPDSCRVKARERRAVRLWVGAYLALAGILGGVFAAINAGQSHRVAERDTLAAQLKLQWDRNEEAQRLLEKIRRLDADITRYNKLASPIRTSEVVEMLAAALPEKASLTAMTLSPRQERPAPVPAKPGEKPAPPKAVSQIAVEIDGVAPTDGDISAFMSSLEANPLFAQVAMEYARSAVIDGVQARTFRVTCRIDLGSRYTFTAQTPERPLVPAPAMKAPATPPGEKASASAQPVTEVQP